MTRVNRPDSILTELRDIKRRLHALETSLRARPAAPPERPDAGEHAQAPEHRPEK